MKRFFLIGAFVFASLAGAPQVFADLVPTDLTATRLFNTTYQNTSGDYKYVTVSESMPSGTDFVRCYIGATSTPGWEVARGGAPNTVSIPPACGFVVPNNYYYRVGTTTSTAGRSVQSWVEYSPSTSSSTSSTASSTIIYAPGDDLFHAMILFLACAAFIIWVMRK